MGDESTTRRFLASGDACERARVCLDGFGDGLAVNKLPFAAASDQAGFAQNLQVMRNRCGSDSAHGNNFSAIHVLVAGNGLKDPEARGISQGFGYFFNLSAVHKSHKSVANPPPFPPEMFRRQRDQPKNNATEYFDVHSRNRYLTRP